jgi:hypothetical protein
MIADFNHGRLFLQEYAGRSYYRYWVVNATTPKVLSVINVTSTEPDMPIVVSPDGSKIYISYVPVEGGERVTAIVNGVSYAVSDRTRQFVVRQSSIEGNSTYYSASGDVFLAYSNDGTSPRDEVDVLAIINGETDQVEKSIPFSRVASGSLDVLGFRNGDLIALDSNSNSTYAVLYDTRSGKISSRTILGGFPDGWTRLTPDGKEIFVDAWEQSGDFGDLMPAGAVVLYDVRTGARTSIAETGWFIDFAPQQSDTAVFSVGDHLVGLPLNNSSSKYKIPLIRDPVSSSAQ